MKNLLAFAFIPFLGLAQTNTFPSSGNVGIGMTSPQYSLDVSGVIRASNSFYSNGGTDNLGAVHWRLTAGNTLRFGLGLINNETGGNQGSDFSIWRYGDDGGHLADAFFIKRNNGNIGIGTAYPETRLHIIGDSRFSGYGWFSRNNNGANTVALSLGQNLDYDAPVVQIYTADDGGANSSNWLGTRWGHFIKFQRASSVGTKNMVQMGGTDGEQFLSVYSVDGSTEKIKFVADGSSYIQGNLGIGTASPQFKLDVEAPITRIKNSSTAFASYTSLRVQGSEYANGLEIDFFGQSNIPGTEWSYGAGAGGAAIVNTNPKPLVFGTSNVGRMIIDASGNVGIATTDTKGYRFAVNGDAIFTKVKVKTYTAWPDYVFYHNYKLRPLKDIESYIKQNNHLPDVPSANEVEKNGLDLGDNQAVLLKKIEELTLYIIDINKKVDKLTEENEKLKKKLSNSNQ